MRKTRGLVAAEPPDALFQHNSALIKKNPLLGALRRRLLKFGGSDVTLMLPDPELPLLLKRGNGFPGFKTRLKKGDENSCHQNAGRLWLKDKKNLRICTGYALSADGLWRQHSWLVKPKEKQIIETTERRVAYYGVALDPGDESGFFCWNNECE